MATLWVHEGFEKDLKRKVSSYTDELDNIRKRYDSALDIVGKYGGSAVSSCEIYLKKRRAALNSASDKAERIQRAASRYVEGVVNTDLTLSQSVHQRSYTFYQEKKIGPQADTRWARFTYGLATSAEDFFTDTVKFFEDLAESIKAFYEEHKYLINLVLDAVAVVGALLMFTATGGFLGIICTIGAAWALTKASYETVMDAGALIAHWAGDEAMAEDLSEKTLAGDLVDLGEAMDEKWGTHFTEVIKGGLIGLEACEFVAEMAKVGRDVKKIFNLDEKHSLQLAKASKRTWAQNLGDLKKIKWGATKATPRLKSALNWCKFGLYTAGFSLEKTARDGKDLLQSMVKDTGKNVGTVKKMQTGTIFLEISPLTKPSYGLTKDIAAILMM